MDALKLETDAPEGWFSQYDIEVLYPEVEAIPENGLYLEVGVYKGRSLWVAKQAAKPSVELWGIDLMPDPKIQGTNYIQSDSHTAEWDKEIDLLFIDAGHSYEDCKADIDKYAPFVKPGGAVLFHDCDETSPGVVRAANEFAKDLGKEVQLFKQPGKNTSIARVQL